VLALRLHDARVILRKLDAMIESTGRVAFHVGEQLILNSAARGRFPGTRSACASAAFMSG